MGGVRVDDYQNQISTNIKKILNLLILIKDILYILQVQDLENFLVFLKFLGS